MLHGYAAHKRTVVIINIALTAEDSRHGSVARYGDN
jgi:hypothetical protein